MSTEASDTSLEVFVTIGGTVAFAKGIDGITVLPERADERARVAAALAFSATDLATAPPSRSEHAQQVDDLARLLGEIGTPEALRAIDALREGLEASIASFAAAEAVFLASLPTVH